MAHRICVIADCDRRRDSSTGWCSMHYRRWKRTGDPEGMRTQPNRHDISPAGAGMLIMTTPDGLERTALYDLADKAAIVDHHWRVLSVGYVATNVGPRGAVYTVLLHRLVLGLTAGDPRIGDHISGDILDCRRANLRVTSHHRNMAHQAITNHKGSSRFRGVSWSKKRSGWYAYQNWNGRMYQLGVHSTEELAAEAVARFRADHGLPTGY